MSTLYLCSARVHHVFINSLHGVCFVRCMLLRWMLLGSLFFSEFDSVSCILGNEYLNVGTGCMYPGIYGPKYCKFTPSTKIESENYWETHYLSLRLQTISTHSVTERQD